MISNSRFSAIVLFFATSVLSTPSMVFAQDSDSTQSPKDPELGSSVEVVSLPKTPQITSTKTGDAIEIHRLATELSHFEVIFLGEQHDNDSGHTFQLRVIQELVASGNNVVISMEQFERDVQGVLNDYLANRIDEEQFLKHARPWKNYAKHYRPIVEFAKENRLPIIAGNIPRPIAASISGDTSVKPADKVFLPRSTTSPENAYWFNFVETMKGHVGTDGTEQLKKYYASQCLKDDAMAEAITDYLAINRHQPKTIVHLCGHFHSDFGLGTVARVVQRSPLLRTSVVTMESLPKNEKLAKDGVDERAHYVVWTEPNNSKTDKPD